MTVTVLSPKERDEVLFRHSELQVNNLRGLGLNVTKSP